LIDGIAFLSPGITVKLVNGEPTRMFAVRSPTNLFVGGKIGSWRNDKNLLVAIMSRHQEGHKPIQFFNMPNVWLQTKRHRPVKAFLPENFTSFSRAINKMERSLRELIAKNSSEEFRGIYVESGLSGTRKNSWLRALLSLLRRKQLQSGSDSS